MIASVVLIVIGFVLTGCVINSEREIIDEINVGHKGRSTEENKSLMIGIFSEKVVFDVDNIELNISYGLDSDFWEEDIPLRCDVIVFVNGYNSEYGSIYGLQESLDVIPDFQILAKYSFEDFFHNGYKADYESAGFLGSRGKTIFNHAESFKISKEFVRTTNNERYFSVGIGRAYYKEDGVKLIKYNLYKFTFGDTIDGLVYIRYEYDASPDNMG